MDLVVCDSIYRSVTSVCLRKRALWILNVLYYHWHWQNVDCTTTTTQEDQSLVPDWVPKKQSGDGDEGKLWWEGLSPPCCEECKRELKLVISTCANHGDLPLQELLVKSIRGKETATHNIVPPQSTCHINHNLHPFGSFPSLYWSAFLCRHASSKHCWIVHHRPDATLLACWVYTARTDSDLLAKEITISIITDSYLFCQKVAIYRCHITHKTIT